MTHNHKNGTRRDFLKTSLAAAAAAGTSRLTARAESQAQADKPTWIVGCRETHLSGLDEPDIWSAMRAFGADGIEVTVNMNRSLPMLFAPGKTFSIANADRIKELADELRKQDKKISAFCLHNNYDAHPKEEIDLTVATAKAAAQLGVPAIRLDIQATKTTDPAKFLAFAISTGKAIIDATSDLSVRFGIENHGRTTNKPEFLREMFEGVGSKRWGLTLDTGNFYWFGHPLTKLYDIYTEFAPWACHTHCKSIHYPSEADRERQRPMGWKYGQYCCPINEGDIDFRKVAGILRKAGYRGDLCIEDESLGRLPKDQRRVALKKELDLLHQVAQA